MTLLPPDVNHAGIEWTCEGDRIRAGLLDRLPRALAVGGFSDGELSMIAAVEPALGAAFRKYWAAAAGARASPPDSRVDDAFASFGEETLTVRECEVARMILHGHSSESICFNLDISLGTVKTHRKNAYAKLSITSQSELLSLFLQSLQTL